MAKVKVYSIDKKEKVYIIDELFEVLSGLKTKQEIIDFLMDLLTPSEVLMVGRRIQIAKMLVAEESYEIIQKKLRVSHMTISKVEHWLKEDENKSKFISSKIRRIIKNKLSEKEKTKNRNGLNRYAHHRLLKNLLK
ncbi:MAG: hypothetical protein COX29_02215 [Candidatus Moranbacteria bacterium CG23_combo_of_CG06-09_8_20_14_all_35_22]|nr:MAG: hypothetical protein COX29_02215 [Candidatus Moranbacteria bacterium CG23_combo_of_CG06-09_8_20_14_all_35_22]